ncbi:hypothetical protein MMC13_004764 [Lambiella insularis]|nr:hypothetical protein [Lambiella insularis]
MDLPLRLLKDVDRLTANSEYQDVQTHKADPPLRPQHVAQSRAFPASTGFPSFNAQPPIMFGDEDARALRSELDELVEEHSRDTIVVLHSWGSVVGTEAVHESLGKRIRESKGPPGGVVGFLYLCAFIMLLYEFLASDLGGNLRPMIKVEEDGSFSMVEPGRRFYSDLPQHEKDHWVSELRPRPSVAQLAPLTYEAYRYHPTMYLYCTADKALPVEVQRMMVAGAGVDFRTETCSAGHSPFLSQPETVLKVVKKMAVKARCE